MKKTNNTQKAETNRESVKSCKPQVCRPNVFSYSPHETQTIQPPQYTQALQLRPLNSESTTNKQ